MNFNFLSFKSCLYKDFRPITLGDLNIVLVFEMVFQQIVAKVAIGFFDLNCFFENTAFVNVTDMLI